MDLVFNVKVKSILETLTCDFSIYKNGVTFSPSWIAKANSASGVNIAESPDGSKVFIISNIPESSAIGAYKLHVPTVGSKRLGLTSHIDKKTKKVSSRIVQAIVSKHPPGHYNLKFHSNTKFGEAWEIVPES